ncbi:MAG: MATE family efflux transporter [Clostridia bacterium]
MAKNLDLTSGSVTKSLLKFTIPILFTILLQTAYGTADLLIVSQFSGVADVSGVTIGSQVMNSITSFFTGLSMGTTILIARYIGAKEKEKSSTVMGTSILLFAFFAIILTLTIVLFKNNIVAIMKTPTESLAQTKSYLLVCGLGSSFILSYNIIGSIFRGIGDSKTPLITVAIACVTNIILDLILIGLFGLGALGAALATVTAQAFSVVLSIIFIRRKTLPFEFTRKNIKLNFGYCKDIIKLGFPIGLQSVMVNISFLVITSIVNTLGVVASAAVGIVEKITGVIMVVAQAFSQSLSAFTAQNMGANQPHRAKKGLFIGMGISLIFGVITAYISAFHGEILLNIFSPDEETLASGLQYLKSYSIDCIFVAIMFSFSGYFVGLGKTTFAMAQNIIGAFCVRIPLAFVFSSLPNTSLFIIGLATPSSSVLQIILCVYYYIYLKRKQENPLAN